MVPAGEQEAAGPIRVAMFAPNRERCGISDYSRNLIKSLAELSSVELVNCVEPPAASGSDSNIRAIASRRSRVEHFRSLAASVSAPPAQILHVQHEFSLFGGVAPHRNSAAAFYSGARIPIVLTVHEIVEESGSALRQAALRLANRKNFIHDAVRGWIVHTQADRERLTAVGAPLSSIHVIPVGVPSSVALSRKSDCRKKLDFEGKRVVTLFGFLSAKKGHLDAMEALAELPSDVVLVFAGGRHPDDRTDYVDNLNHEIERRGLRSRIRITGFLPPEALAEMLGCTDVAIAPYHNSSGSASVAHLLSAGLPVVASDVPTFREVTAESPGALLLTKARRPDLLASSILNVLGSDDVRGGMLAAAAQYMAKHSYSAVAQATVQVYRRAIVP